MSLCVRVAAVIATLSLLACAGPALQIRNEAAASHVDRLQPLASKAQLVRYLKQVELAQQQSRARRMKYRADSDQDELDEVVVTGSRIVEADVITNNQEAGVDEGDFVKKNGRWLIVLRDSQLHVLDTGNAAQPQLTLRSSLRLGTGDRDSGIWYDELLAYGEGRLLVLGFNYAEDMAELGFFNIDPVTGAVQRGARYGLRSGDYFSGENYGARLHDGALQIQLTTKLSSEDEDWPAMLRMDQPGASWQSLADVDDLYLPLIPTDDLQVHWVVRCPLDLAEHSLQACASRGVVGSWSAEHYVSRSASYLAMADWDPAVWRQPGLTDSPERLVWTEPNRFLPFRRTMVYRLPHDLSEAPTAARFSGQIEDQFALSEQDGQLWLSSTLQIPDATGMELHDRHQLQYLPLQAFTAAGDARSRELVAMDLDAESVVETRFDQGLVWLALSGDKASPSNVWRIQLADAQVERLKLPADFLRIEPVPGAALMIGGADPGPPYLTLSLLNAKGPLALLDHLALADRFASDDRSHGFAYRPLPGGEIVGGFPVEYGQGDPWSEDWQPAAQWLWIRDQRLHLSPLLDMQGPACPDCDDWYGSARVFFPADRMFALNGQLLREVQREGDQVRVLREVLLPLQQ